MSTKPDGYRYIREYRTKADERRWQLWEVQGGKARRVGTAERPRAADEFLGINTASVRGPVLILVPRVNGEGVDVFRSRRAITPRAAAQKIFEDPTPEQVQGLQFIQIRYVAELT